MVFLLSLSDFLLHHPSVCSTLQCPSWYIDITTVFLCVPICNLLATIRSFCIQHIQFHFLSYMFRYSIHHYNKQKRNKTGSLMLYTSSDLEFSRVTYRCCTVLFTCNYFLPQTSVNNISWYSIKSLFQIYKSPLFLFVSFQYLFLQLSQYEHHTHCTSPWLESKLVIMFGAVHKVRHAQGGRGSEKV